MFYTVVRHRSNFSLKNGIAHQIRLKWRTIQAESLYKCKSEDMPERLATPAPQPESCLYSTDTNRCL